MKDICCIGHITHDQIITPHLTASMAGGTAYYMAHGMNKLPHNVSFHLVTKVGDDALGEIEKLRGVGIDVTCFHSEHTVFFENKYGENANNRQQRVLAKADPFTVEEMKGLDAKIYHLGSLLADDFSLELVKELSSRGIVSIDVQGYLREVIGEEVVATRWKEMEAVLPHTDILKLNEHEMEAITPYSDPHKVAYALNEYGVKEVVITLGSNGSLIYAEGQFYEIPAYRPRKIVDATGCGDTYSTGYLWCRSQGIGYEEAGKFAAAMCALKLEHAGPFDGTIEDIRAVESTLL
ncbi:MAG: ribokinase [Bacteroidales bacterium]|nr:ribokinase [Bacteroidales bacterium]